MTTGRVARLDLAEARGIAEEHGLPAQLAELNIFRVLLRNPALAKATSDLLLTLLFRSSLDHRLRELVIMRLGWATASSYEWTQHWPIALEQFGCSEEDLLALRDWEKASHFGEAERAVLAATDETLERGTLSPATWERCRAHVGDEVACMELVASVATWRWISQVTRSLEIPLEEGVEAWPPDGLPATPPGG
ncbi:MAG: carboxymuconolactone decarboxylase family protein [Myxococcota bacterium]|nr:carboxymuconolactone decarboxylase family protein [Myxococcota bacterium]